MTIPAVVAGALAGTMGLSAASAFAADTQPTTAEAMQKQIDALKAQVQQLQGQQPTMSSKAVDDTVARVLEDADKRSQLMQVEGFTAGWNNGRFAIMSADGNSSIMPYLQVQFRSTSNIDTGGEDDNTEWGFSLPRVKLGFDGTIYSKDLSYYFRWNSGDSDGGGSGALNLEQAWARYMFADQMGVRAGQFIDPVFKEQLVNSDSQLAADRSLLNTIITGADESYTQGVTFIWMPDPRMNLEVGLTDGINTGNTSFRDFPNGPANFGIAGRFEFAVFGNVDDTRGFTAMGTKEDVLVIGAGADFTQAGNTDNVLHTVDVQWEGMDGRLGVYGAYVGQYLQNGSGTGITGVTDGDDDNYNWGILVQAGWMLNSDWEIFGRYDMTSLDSDIAVGSTGQTQDNFQEVTIGLNHYFKGQNAKWTLDVSWLPNGAPTGASNLGILNSDDTEFVVRTQFQLML
ncbi:MAG: hypothetical protein H7Z14_14615 [Anaerolineae bacterium]|nr:hypothetical protein [Phycisphaerae bacterium]